MSFKPGPVQPDFSSLVVSLDNSKTQLSNYSLYQTILFLIRNTQKARDLLVADVDTINEQISEILAASFLTINDESNDFPNSRQIRPGSGITFMDNGAQLLIGASPIPIDIEHDEEVCIPLPGPRGPTGLTGPISTPLEAPSSFEQNFEEPISTPFGTLSGPEQHNFYSEGSWTPVIGGTGGESGQTYDTQNGFYTKVGKLVAASFNVTLSNKGTITTDVAIKGFPFAAKSGAPGAFMPIQWERTVTLWSIIFGIIVPLSTQALVRGAAIPATTADTPLTTVDIANNTAFRAMMIYYTD